MVYGRILYNNIKEYTPKWYPTIPYSQTVKPIFSTFHTYFQENRLKSSLPWIPPPTLGLDGDCSLKYSNITHGCGKFSSSDLPSRCITQFTFHWSQFTNLTTLIEPTKPQWLRRKLTRRNSNKSKMLKEEANDFTWTFCNSYLLQLYLILNPTLLIKEKWMHINSRISERNLNSATWIGVLSFFLTLFLFRLCSITSSVSWFTQSLWLYFLTFCLTKCTFPNKNIAVCTPCGKEISFFRKLHCIYLRIVSIHCIA